jgi:uncharacterized damage-inducible protein DinB
MDAKEFALLMVASQERNVLRIIDTLTDHELAWRPASGCNSIGFLLYHLARGDDSFMMPALTGQKAIFDMEGWGDRLGMPATEGGGELSAEQVNAFVPPPRKELNAYSQAVRARVLSLVKAMKAEEFDRKINAPYFGETTVGALVAIMMDHTSQHIGEMSYLRGLQRGINK